MASHSLNTLLRANHIGQARQRASLINKALDDEYPARTIVQEKLHDSDLHGRLDQNQRDAVEQIMRGNNAKSKLVAEYLNITQDAVDEFARSQEEYLKRHRKRVGDHKRAWTMLLKAAPIQVINAQQFPPHPDKPFILFYSADWCGPCQEIKPTFARLSHHFDRAPLYYTTDEDLHTGQGLQFFPSIVAHFPDGRKSLILGWNSTQQLWDALHGVLSQGSTYDGDGMLICREGSCSMMPLDFDLLFAKK